VPDIDEEEDAANAAGAVKPAAATETAARLAEARMPRDRRLDFGRDESDMGSPFLG
jgi:hypothetical protein